tara:strand:- start:1857 stop:4259 length:2403 start_codon:yes stop_codon:yes gene_type:complete
VKRVGVKKETCTGGVLVPDETGCKALSDLTGTGKQAAREALKNGMPDEGKKLKEVSYTNVADRKDKLIQAKNARRAYLKDQQDLMGTAAAWKDLVIEDDNEFEGYTDQVLAKRQTRIDAGKSGKIRYRVAPATGLNCDFDTPDLTLTKEDGMDTVDPEGCVTIGVEVDASDPGVLEPGVIKMTKNGDKFDLECNDGASSPGLDVGKNFTCKGRVWDIGTATTDPNEFVGETIWVDDGDTGEPYYNFYTNADCTDASTGKLTPDTPYMFKRCVDTGTSHPFAVNSGSGWQPSGGITGEDSVIVTTGSSGTVGWKCTNHPITMAGDFCVGASACVFTPTDLTKLKDAVNLCIVENPTGDCPTLAGTDVPSGQGSGKYGVIGSWNVSQVTSFQELFMEKFSFDQDIGEWDTSNVTSLADTFYYASAFNQPIGDWDTSSVTTLFSTFDHASAFNQSIGDWNTSKVTTLYWTFYEASAFNQPIGDWDVSSVSTLRYTFSSASAFNQPIGDWDVSKVSTLRYTFSSARAFNQSIGEWDISNVEDLTGTFTEASSFNQDLSSWVTTLNTGGTLFEGSAMCEEVKDGKCNCAGDERDEANGVCQVSGCMVQGACNYNALAITDDDSCAINDCAGTCGGSATNDDCGVCNGPGEVYECGCSDISWAVECDCDGNVLDGCDVCGGDNSTCAGCDGVPNSVLMYDVCGVCGGTGIPAGKCDCYGKVLDECGDCGGSGIPDGECDCNGNVLDVCGVCGGSGIPDGECDCDGNVFDECGTCGGDGSSCPDTSDPCNPAPTNPVEYINAQCCQC